MRTLLVVVVLASLGSTSCKEEEKEFPSTDPRLQTRRYCNDPSAVNYNWNFPGTADNSTCFYGSDLFTGGYRYLDSVFSPAGVLDSARSGTEYQLDIQRIDSNSIRIVGFCPTGEILYLTAPRIGFRATFDSSGRYGQRLCRVRDTISGALTRELADTTTIKLNFTVRTDSTSVLHRGTAYRR